MKNKIITIIGGSGFIGKHLAQHLAQQGALIKIVARHPERAKQIKVVGNVGQICFYPADIKDKIQLKQAITNSDIVINLASTMRHDDKNSIMQLNKEAAVNVAKLTAEMKIKQHIYFSALGVNRAYKACYAHNKQETEKQIKAINPSSIIIRPGVVYGPGDNFLNFLLKIACYTKVMPYLWQSNKKLQLLYVEDLVKAISKIILAEDKYNGSIFEFADNTNHSLSGLLRSAAKILHLNPIFLPIPSLVAKILTWIGEKFFHAPFTREHIDLLQYDYIIHKEDGMLYLTNLDIKAKKFEEIAPLYLKMIE